jgi:hypothetical protein
MQASAYFSVDGVSPVLNGGIPSPVSPVPGTVPRAGCITWRTEPGKKPSFPAGVNPRYLMIVARYGTDFIPAGAINNKACPTTTQLAAGNIQIVDCAFRKVYDLGYHQ